MRVHPWIASILCVLALSTGRSLFAQYEGTGIVPAQGFAGAPPAYPGGAVMPDGANFPGGGFVPPPPIAPTGAWDPIAAGQNGGPGYHPDRQPWPHISPFENRFEQHTNEGGLWFLRRDNSARKYFANFDIRVANYRRPDQTRVGADVAVEDLPNLGGNPLLQFLPTDTGVFFNSFLGNLDQVNTIAVNEQSREADPSVNGFLLEWGYLEPTQNGFDFSIWYTPEGHWAYSRGFSPTRQEVLNNSAATEGRPLTITNSLPIFDGEEFRTLVFDSFYGLDFRSVSGGGDVNWSFTPIRRGDWYKITPTMGFQAMYIGEDFSVQGVDSGLQRTFVTSGLASNFNPILGFDQAHQLTILSEVNSYLAGPQVGIRYEIGGDNLKIRGHSQVGVAINREKLSLYGFGVGDPFVDLSRQTGFNPAFNQDFQFREEQEHTRLSPTTSHEITAEAELFSWVPVINRISFLEQAKFRFGYQIQAAYEIKRPHRTIEYNGLPLIPAIRNDQETRFYVESWNFGVHWTY